VFSGNVLTVDQATVDGQAVTASSREGQIVLDLGRSLSRGQSARLALDYHGTPARGLVFGRRSFYTSYFTCDWMFCAQDRPGDKAGFTATLILPQGMASVGPGVSSVKAPAGPGLEAHVWNEARPYPSYVFGLAAGELQSYSQPAGEVELVVLSEIASPERLAALFGSTGEMLRFFEQKAGVKFPHARYVQLLVSGDEAQEAETFSILGEEVMSPILEDPKEDWAIAHELAHQWWGNLVTCKDWSQFWLNEGITTFMVAAWKEHRWGRAAYDREMDLARRRLQKAVQAGLDVPLTYPGPYPSLSVRRAIQYSKAALFLDRLRQVVGQDAFWQGLREFTGQHAGQTVDSGDFQRAFEHASGRDLEALFHEWVKSNSCIR
jgi:aminopeptidase N